MDYEHARFNMIEQQIRTWEVLDPRVLALLSEVRREDYVPPQYKSLAFADMEIPLGHGELMLAPKLEARLVQELALTSGDSVLEIGTGSGYMTALLAKLARHVYSVERIASLADEAQRALARHGITNATVETGDGARGWSPRAPYDAIVLTGSVPVLPEAFRQQLKTGGRLLAIVGEAPVMTAQLTTAVGAGAFNTVGLFETCVPPLRNALQPERFVF
jgi:protein-L-isoaspartate(D-aspartate) O-methyltransferase